MLLALAYRLPGDPTVALRAYLRACFGFLLILAGAILLAHLLTSALIIILPALLKLAGGALIITIYAAATKPRSRCR